MTYKERFKRRALIAGFVADGGSTEHAAVKYGVCYTTAAQACREHGVSITMKQGVIQERRAKIAEYVGKGHSCGDAARKFGVCYTAAHSACLEHNVQVPTVQRHYVSSFRILAALQQRSKGETQTAIAQRFGVTRQRISQVKQLAESEGISTRPRRSA